MRNNLRLLRVGRANAQFEPSFEELFTIARDRGLGYVKPTNPQYPFDLSTPKLAILPSIRRIAAML